MTVIVCIDFELTTVVTPVKSLSVSSAATLAPVVSSKSAYRLWYWSHIEYSAAVSYSYVPSPSVSASSLSGVSVKGLAVVGGVVEVVTDSVS